MYLPLLNKLPVNIRNNGNSPNSNNGYYNYWYGFLVLSIRLIIYRYRSVALFFV